MTRTVKKLMEQQTCVATRCLRNAMGLSYLPDLQSTPADITQTVARVGLLPLFIIHFDGFRCWAALPPLSHLGNWSALRNRLFAGLVREGRRELSTPRHRRPKPRP